MLKKKKKKEEEARPRAEDVVQGQSLTKKQKLEKLQSKTVQKRESP